MAYGVGFPDETTKRTQIMEMIPRILGSMTVLHDQSLLEWYLFIRTDIKHDDR